MTTNNYEVARKIRMLRDHGQPKKYYHDVEGYHGRLDAIQAGLLQVKLRQLPRGTGAGGRPRSLIASYSMQAGMEDLVVYEPEWSRSVYHLYVIRVVDRDGFMKSRPRPTSARQFTTRCLMDTDDAFGVKAAN